MCLENIRTSRPPLQKWPTVYVESKLVCGQRDRERERDGGGNQVKRFFLFYTHPNTITSWSHASQIEAQIPVDHHCSLLKWPAINNLPNFHSLQLLQHSSSSDLSYPSCLVWEWSVGFSFHLKAPESVSIPPPSLNHHCLWGIMTANGGSYTDWWLIPAGASTLLTSCEGNPALSSE